MSLFVVSVTATGAEVYRYEAPVPVEWAGMEFATHTHTALPDTTPALPPARNPADWYISVGAFFDRFGALKYPILASTDPVVQAIIKDASVRKYLHLLDRRADLMQAVQVLQAKGFAVDPAALLDVQPGPTEVWDGR